MTEQANQNGQERSLPNGQTPGVKPSCSGDHPTASSSFYGKGHDPELPVPIAIVGVSCRFAGDATSPSKLWEVCVNGKSAWTPIPSDRFDANAIYDPDPERPGRHHVRGGHFFAEDLELFDAGFFNLSTDIADAMDPQLRLLLESVYEATEDAGIPLQKLAGSNTSVTAGCFGKDYYELLMRDPQTMPRHTMTSAGMTMLSNRISHFFDLQGPSVSIDTACSTSLVALHQGCQTIRHRESELAIVGASCVLLNPDMFVGESMQGVLGPEGKCHALDARAGGYGRGEGVAAVILKRLDAAIRDGDRVHSVIRNTAVNQDGRTATVTSPSVDAQEKLIRECYAHAGLDMASTAFVEGHLTGTSVGDPIEAEAIARTFGRSRPVGSPPVLVGSVKANLGHTEAASGLASLVKAIYMLKEKVIPPQILFEKPNPNIPLQDWNLKATLANFAGLELMREQVPVSVTAWPEGFPLRVSVNNFGYGGTNAHLILEGAPTNGSNDDIVPTGDRKCAELKNGTLFHHSASSTEATAASYVFIVSAKDSSSAESSVRQLADHLDTVAGSKREPRLGDLAFTMTERRTRLSWIVAFHARTLSELVELFRQPGIKPARPMRTPRLGFVFNGNGAQWRGMGRELLAAYPVFAHTFYLADSELKKLGESWSLTEELSCTQSANEEKTQSSISQIRQAIVVAALQIALVDLLESWNIRPSGVASHSMGEIAAAYAVGALTLQQAIRITLIRSSIFIRHNLHVSGGGGMLAAGIGHEEAASYISRLNSAGHITVACINSPASVTLSGDIDAIDQMEGLLKDDGVFARRLNVSIPFHSQLMLPIVPEYTERVSAMLPVTCHWDKTGPTFASPVTGGIIGPHQGLDSEHWVRNLVQPTLFSSALEAMVYGVSPDASSDLASPQANIDMIVEIGAHSQLSGSIRQILSQHGTHSMPYSSCLKRSVNAVDTMHDLVVSLARNGYPVDLAAVNNPHKSSLPSFVPDLPSYPWSHGKRHRVLSRQVHEHKFPRHPAHALLGLPVAGSNPLTPTWRHFLRISDGSLPWLVDHQLDGTIVFPGAGYVTMAMEAARMTVDQSESQTHGYKLRDIEIVAALQIPDDGRAVEIIFQMEPCSNKNLDSDGWWDFRVSSTHAPVSKGPAKLVENCRGSVMAQRATVKSAEKNWWKQQSTISDAVQHDEGIPSLDAREQAVGVDTGRVFAEMREMGIYHGPAFQNLVSVRASVEKGSVVSDFTISEAVSATDSLETGCQSTYALHPTTLDSAFQAGYAALDANMKKDFFYVPRSIGSIYVPKDVKRQGGHQLRALTRLNNRKKGRGFSSNITIFDLNDADDVESSSSVRIDDLYFQALPRNSKDVNDSSSPDLTCGKQVWVNDVLRAIPAGMRDPMLLQLTNDEQDWEERVRCGAFYLIQDAVSELRGDSQDKWEWNHKKLMAWMEAIVSSAGSNRDGPELGHKWAKSYSASTPESRGEFLKELSSESIPGQLMCRIGAHLAGIIRGQVTPLELMMEDGLLGRYYETLPCTVRSYQHISTVVSLLSARNSTARVLEIGAGTGGATTSVLTALSSSVAGDDSDSKPAPKFAHYDFSDVSAGFFDSARQKFGAWDSKGLMSFKRLNIEIDPNDQPDFGPESAGTYDLVVASLVLHATSSLERTLRNVHKLLRPGGTLVMIECTRDRLDTHLVFGTLPGWWLSEEPGRKMSPMATLEEWDRVLRATGFAGGVEFHLGDCEVEEYQTCSVLVTTATPADTNYPSEFTLVYVDFPPPGEWVTTLRDMVWHRMGAGLQVERLKDLTVPDIQNKVCICLDEMRDPVIYNMGVTVFEKLRSLLVESRGILWVTSGGAIDIARPELALAQGLLRTVRQEDQSKRCALLDLERKKDNDATPWTTDTARHITRILHATFDFNTVTSNTEFEYAIKDSITYVPRVVPDATITLDHTDSTATGLFHKPGRDLTLRCDSNGSLSAVHFVETSTFTGELQTGFVEIEPRAFGLNFRDVLTILGEIDGESIVGQECSGVISRLGPGTGESGLSVGDRVCAICDDSWGTRQRARWQCVVPIPDCLSWAQAAAIPIAYGTAWITLREHARLREGESILVHAATGGFGQAVLTLARHLRAGTIFATCGTPEKRDLLVHEYGLREENIFSSRNDEFASAIMEKTGGKGVDVIINSLAGPLFKASWQIIARNGRLVDVGKRDSQAGRHLDMRPFRRCATLSAIDLATDALDPSQGGRPHLVRAAITECVELLAEGSIRITTPLVEYPMSQMEKAIRSMQAGTHLGKIVLAPQPNDEVRVAYPPQSVVLPPQATYLIAGGARGIGVGITRWMMEHGAEHLVLVSRTASSAEGAESLKQMASERQCDLQFHDCDIADEQAFLAFFSWCRESLPPIRGIITGAMVLDDTVLESMTYSQWQRATAPKVNGTMNLHKYLGDDVDFFIMLSSLVGVTGNASQANYAAGNTFQDALAHHRTQSGKPAVSLALGAVQDVGYVATADRAIADRTVAFLGGTSINMAQILRLIEDAVRRPLRTLPGAAHVLAGIPRHVGSTDSGFSRDARFAHLWKTKQDAQAMGDKTEQSSAASLIPSLVKALSTANLSLNLEEAAPKLCTLIALKISEIFSLSTEEIDVSLSLVHYGVDSLVGVELRNWLGSSIRVNVSIFEIVQSSSIIEFAQLIAERISGRQ